MKKPRRRVVAKKVSSRVAVVGETKRRKMLAIVIRNRTAFLAVRDFLTPGILRTADAWSMGCVLRIVRDHYDAHQSLPSKDVLRTEVQEYAESDEPELWEEEEAEIDEFLDYAFDKDEHGSNVSKSTKKARWAIQAAKDFLADCYAEEIKDNVHREDSRPRDMPAMLDECAAKARAIEALGAPATGVPFPTGWDRQVAPPLFSTGVSVLDMFLGGGHLAGETYLLFAPFGACKTLLAVMATVEGARAASVLEEENEDGRVPLVAFVSYEAPLAEWQQRCVAYAAQIPRDRVREAMSHPKGMKFLSASSKKLQPYEQRLFRAQSRAGEEIQPERVRADEAIKLLNRHVVFIDMTNSAQRPGAGGGYVSEVVRELQKILHDRKNTYLMVLWLDYLGAMAKRHLQAGGYDNDDLRHLISNGVLQLGTQIAKPMDCPVWVTHQLSGEANSRSPTASLDHTDAAEAKNAAENADFAIVAGKPTEPEQLCVMKCTKHRRQPPRERAVVRIEGEFSRIIDVSDRYTIDLNRHQILSNEDCWVSDPRRAKIRDAYRAVEG